MKMLGPWPVLQFIFGIAVLGGGVWMIIRGTQKQDPKASSAQIEDKRSEWEAYNQLRNIEENSFKQLDIQKQMLERMNNNADQLKALAAAIWNRGMGRDQ